MGSPFGGARPCFEQESRPRFRIPASRTTSVGLGNGAQPSNRDKSRSLLPFCTLSTARGLGFGTCSLRWVATLSYKMSCTRGSKAGLWPSAAWLEPGRGGKGTFTRCVRFPVPPLWCMLSGLCGEVVVRTRVTVRAASLRPRALLPT